MSPTIQPRAPGFLAKCRDPPNGRIVGANACQVSPLVDMASVALEKTGQKRTLKIPSPPQRSSLRNKQPTCLPESEPSEKNQCSKRRETPEVHGFQTDAKKQHSRENSQRELPARPDTWPQQKREPPHSQHLHRAVVEVARENGLTGKKSTRHRTAPHASAQCTEHKPRTAKGSHCVGHNQERQAGVCSKKPSHRCPDKKRHGRKRQQARAPGKAHPPCGERPGREFLGHEPCGPVGPKHIGCRFTG